MVSKHSLSLMKFIIKLKQNLKKQVFKRKRVAKKLKIKTGENLRAKLQTL
ncbi:hypothetical protein HpBGD130_00130 [Helicobacter pylori]